MSEKFTIRIKLNTELYKYNIIKAKKGSDRSTV
jgi:hypothetical protein